MSNKKISQLPRATVVLDSDFPVVQGGINKKLSESLLMSYERSFLDEDSFVSNSSSASPSQQSTKVYVDNSITNFASVSSMATKQVSASINALRVMGYSTAGDGGDALYKKVGSQPTHEGKFQSADGAWWELAETIIKAEMFGAIGDGVADDDIAIFNMTGYGRAKGTLCWELRSSSSIYTIRHAMMFSGIRYLKIDGKGAAIMNIRGGAVDVGFVSNYEGIHFGTVFQTNGSSDYAGSGTPYYTGETIASATASSTTITVTGSVASAAGFTAGARIFIYGFSSGNTGFPPDPKISEYNEIESIVGNVITLRRKLAYDYDSRWPEVPGSLVYGAARVISMDRPNFTGYDKLIIENLRTLPNPNWTTVAATTERNGRITVGGYSFCELKGVRSAGGIYVSQGEYIHTSDIDIHTAIEFDKCIDVVKCDRPKNTQFSAGNGCRSIELNDPIGQDFWNLSPIKNLTIRRGRLAAMNASTSALLGTHSGLTEIVDIDGTEIVADTSTKTGLIAAFFKDATITRVDDTQLTMTRSAFDTSQLSRACAPDMTLYKTTATGTTATAAFKLNKLPYEVAGTVFIEGASLIPITTGDTLRAFTNRHVKTRNVRVIGPEAFRVRTLSAPVNIAVPIDFDTYDIGPNFFTIDQRVVPVTGGAIDLPIGRKMFLNRISIDVSRAYTGASGVATLQLRNFVGSVIFFTIDLKVAGCRVIDSDIFYNFQVTDTPGAAINPLPLWVAEIRVTSALTVASAIEAPLWMIRAEGIRSPDF